MPVNVDIAKKLIIAEGAFSDMYVGAPLSSPWFDRDGEKTWFPTVATVISVDLIPRLFP